jgi:hypothetical protein
VIAWLYVDTSVLHSDHVACRVSKINFVLAVVFELKKFNVRY